MKRWSYISKYQLYLSCYQKPKQQTDANIVVNINDPQKKVEEPRKEEEPKPEESETEPKVVVEVKDEVDTEDISPKEPEAKVEEGPSDEPSEEPKKEKSKVSFNHCF